MPRIFCYEINVLNPYRDKMTGSRLGFRQGQKEGSVSRSPKAQGSYRLELCCVCALTTPWCVSMCVVGLVDGNGSTGSDSVTLP